MNIKKKYYVFILLCCLPFVFLLMFYISFLKIDSKYSGVVNDEIESMTLIQKITSESINNYFILRNMTNSKADKELDENRSTWGKHKNQITAYIDSLSNVHLIKDLSKPTFDYLIGARQDYLSKCDTFLRFADSQDRKKALDYFQKEVEYSFFVYQNYINNFISIHKAEVTEYNNSITRQIKIFGFDSSIFGFPFSFLLLIIYLVITFVFLIMCYRILFLNSNKK